MYSYCMGACAGGILLGGICMCIGIDPGEICFWPCIPACCGSAGGGGC